MKAMIFAAGLGTRLRPLTEGRPKALVEVGGMSLLEIALRRLRFFGIREVVVNVHHFAGQVKQLLAERNGFGMDIAVSDERDRLLNTGGGLKKARWFFDDGAPFIVQNVDVLSTLDLKAFYEHHRRSGAMATLAVRDRPTSRYLLFDGQWQLLGWQNRKSGEQRWSRMEQTARPFAFSGIQVVSPALFEYFPQAAVFSTIDLFLEAAKKEPIIGYPHDKDAWLDVGKLPALAEAEALLPELELG